MALRNPILISSQGNGSGFANSMFAVTLWDRTTANNEDPLHLGLGFPEKCIHKWVVNLGDVSRKHQLREWRLRQGCNKGGFIQQIPIQQVPSSNQSLSFLRNSGSQYSVDNSGSLRLGKGPCWPFCEGCIWGRGALLPAPAPPTPQKSPQAKSSRDRHSAGERLVWKCQGLWWHR